MAKNLAFKLNYNDGGADSKRIGFRGTCSNRTMEWNIRQNHSWCTNEQCECGDFYRNQFRGEQPEFPCYESKALIEWYFEAGISYTAKGEEPRAIRNAEVGRYAFLTTRFPYADESERRIIGFFQLGEIITKIGEASRVLALADHYVELYKDEPIYFWDYYSNENSPSKCHWGTGLFRYLSDEQTLFIMRDILKIKKSGPEKEKARELMNQFAFNVNIDPYQLVQPRGARKL